FSATRLVLTLTVSSFIAFIVATIFGSIHSYWFYLVSFGTLIIFISFPIISSALITEYTNLNNPVRLVVFPICLIFVGLLAWASFDSIFGPSQSTTNSLLFDGNLYYGTRTLKPLIERGYSLYKCDSYGIYCEGLVVGSVKDPDKDVSMKLQNDRLTNSLEFWVNDEVIYRLKNENRAD
ncbi:MAG: hypothetical protein KDF65_13905, partial [Anaerolineae bacterium]|nr:hypothetical protein [Anaerolineae bacterium]